MYCIICGAKFVSSCEGKTCPTCEGAVNRMFPGMSAEHLLELVQAEKDGRLVVLPCKVGDTCYTIGEEDDEQGPERVMIKGIGALAMGSNSIMFLDPDFIYPTIEAAEAALEGETYGRIN